MAIDTRQFFDSQEAPLFLTKREKKLQKRLKKTQVYQRESQASRSDIRCINPLTKNQEKTYEAYANGKNLLLHGVAGTGKTFLALYLSLNSIIKGEHSKPIIILRSVVPGRDMGFLPGKMEEKIAVYEEPYRGICAELTNHPTSYDYFKRNEYIEFSTTSYLRGLTFRNNIIIIDECQNMTFSELDTIMTRVGEGCRVIFCGDFRQTDLIRDDERKGLLKFMNVVKSMHSFESVEFNKEDIVRSKLVKEYIVAKLEKGIV